MSASAVLSISGISKRYGSVQALKNVSIDVAAGEVFGYLGPNGAGKTTTIRTALGLVRPDAGSVRILGRTPDDRLSRQGVGFLPGEFRLWESMTGRAVLDHFARYRSARPTAVRARVLAALGLDDRTLARRVKTLSHGTRQKLGLVIALQHDPDLLLLDEPTLGLDPLVQRAFLDIVRELAARGRAVLLSSHVLSEVEAVCSRVAIVRAGEIVATETVASLRRGLLRRLTVRFRGVPPDGLLAVPGIERVERVERDERDGEAFVLFVRGDVNPVIRTLAAHDLDELSFPDPLLEDVFVSYYGPAR